MEIHSNPPIIYYGFKARRYTWHKSRGADPGGGGGGGGLKSTVRHYKTIKFNTKILLNINLKKLRRAARRQFWYFSYVLPPPQIRKVDRRPSTRVGVVVIVLFQNQSNNSYNIFMQTSFGVQPMNTVDFRVDCQRGVNTVWQCSVENQTGVIAVMEHQWNIVE